MGREHIGLFWSVICVVREVGFWEFGFKFFERLILLLLKLSV